MGAVAFVLLLVLAPVAPTASLGAAATATGGPDGAAPSTASVSDSVDEQPERRVRFDGGVRREKLSGGLRFQLQDASANERVPVLVVFDRQPDGAFDLNRLESAEARQRMQALAEDSQANVLDYLEGQAERGRATDVRSFWIRNVIAVEAHPAVIEELTASTQVDRVVYDSPVRRADGNYTGDAGAFLSGLGEYGNLSVSPDGLERETSGISEWSVEYIGAADVQEAGVTGEGVNVSVVDTGIDDDHPAIPTVAEWRDFTPANESSPVDPHGHGTHVAGTVAGQRDAKRAVGVAPGVNLFGARALDAEGVGRSSDLIDAFQWSANESADVVSASLGQSPVLDSTTQEVAVASASSGDAAFDVFASGNATTSSDDSEAFRPAYVLVQVEPTAYNGSSLTPGSSTQASVEGNLSLVLQDPNGNSNLTEFEAGYMFRSGEVPDGIKLLKYKPDSAREIRDGTWNLTVENGNSESVSVNVTTVPVYPSNGSDEVSRVADNLATQGVVPVIAAGNDGAFLGNQSVGSPGTAADAITVGASGYQINDVAPFSSRGPVGFGADARPGVDLIAPGASIVSAGSTEAYAGEEPYVPLSGTSMATPHVSGTVALLLSETPGMSVSEVESTLQNNAQSVPGGENAVGAGVLDAWTAVNGTTDLGPRGTEQGVRDLWAGVGNAGGTNVNIDVEPASDPAGDAGTAPDLETAYTDGESVDFQFGFADTASPNGSVTVYMDVDGNRTTGAQFTTPTGAEYRLDATRTYLPGDDTYTLAVETYGYNNTTARFEPEALTVYDPRADGDFVGFQLADSELSGVDDDRYDWWVVSRNGSDVDRIPDSGVLDTLTTANVSGIAVTWNSTAGVPAANVPVNFSVYDQDTGALVGSDTVRTNTSGLAETEFTVRTTRGGYGEFALEVRDDRGNRVTQTYALYGRQPRFAYYRGLPYEVDSANYLSEPNASVSLNIPIYRIDDGSYEKYGGNASLELQNYEAPNENDTAYVNDLTVTDGVLRTTVDFSTLELDDYGGQYADVSVEVALESDFRNRTGGTEYAGRIELATERYETDLGPDSTVVAPGGSANLTFQNVLASTEFESRQQRAANVTADYNVTWVKDRYVASVYRDLPDSVAQSVRQARTGEARLGDEEHRELREAIDNISADGVTVEYVSGQATPSERGIGGFQVTPPSDARFGIVEAGVNASAAGDVPVTTGGSIVFVDSRFSQYVREPTPPTEDNQYALVIDGYWPEHREGDYVVPNETIEVDVALYDYLNDTYVDGATVSLYTSGGATKTVTTSGSGEITTEIAAPALDYRNITEFSFREQQVVGIAQGYREADGRAVADNESVYATSYEVGVDGLKRPDPELRWSDDRLNLTLRYRNATFDRVSGTETLVQIGSPDTFDTREDVFVGFVNGANASVYNDSYDAPVPSDTPREWEVGTQTPSLGLFSYWVDEVQAGGPQVTIGSPSTLRPNVTQDVTLNVTDRNGQPITGAVVRFSWIDFAPVEETGESFFGTTDANGQVTFQVTPTAAESDDLGLIGDVTYSIGVATENYSSGVYLRDTIAVSEQRVNVTGRIVDSTGSGVSNDLVIVENGDKQNLTTDSNGRFEFTGVPDTYAFLHIQGDRASTTDDEIPDLRPLGTRDVSGDTDLGTFGLPQPYDVDFSIVNESGVPVENATVVAYQKNGSSVGFLARSTDANGQIPADGGRGFDLEGNVTIYVAPPDTGEFADETYVRNVTVDSDRTERFELREHGRGDLEVTPDEVYANVTDAGFALRNATYDAAPDTYVWAFGDGSTANTTADTTSHVYTRAGEYTATVSVYNDSAGRLLTAETNVTVTQAGSADFTATPSTADVNVDEVEFALSNVSVDENVTVANYTYAFGDGERVTTDDATLSVTHTYATLAGEVTARVTAYNASQTVLFSESVNVSVVDTVDPAVRVSAPESVPQNVDFEVNASRSSDNYVIANYTFETSDEFSNTSTSPTRTLNFSEPGTHTVTVTVTDAVGNTNATTATVEVLGRPDLAVDVSASDTQRRRLGVNATVNVTNVGTADATDSFTVRVNATNGTLTNRTSYSVSGLTAGERNGSVVDLTAWTRSNRITGDVTVDVSVTPVTNETVTDNNEDSVTTTVEYRELGDVSGDGTVDATDASTIGEAVANGTATDPAADVDVDGEVTAADAMLVAQRASGVRNADYEIINSD